MGSAFPSFLPALIASAEARAARRGRAFLVLDAALARVLYANAGGRRVFGLSGDATVPTVLARQIRSGARALDERGAAALLLRTAATYASRPVAATATRLGEGADGAVLLAAENRADDDEAPADPQRLLRDLGFDPDEAALFDIDGRLIGGTCGADDLASPIAAFVAEEDAVRRVETGAGIVHLTRIEDDRVLAVREKAQAPSPAESAARPANIAALVNRWQSHRTVENDEPAQDAVPLTDDAFPARTPPAGAPDDAANAPPASTFVPDFASMPIRFVWQIDADGRFRSFSPEFAETVGPLAADVVGETFGAVAERFGFDANGAIRRLLDRRDTWSGRTVLWPVENSDRRVPIDLAALPTFSRERRFDGFRGFGIVRVVDHESDPEGRGHRLPALAASEPASEFEPAPQTPPEAPASPKPVFRTFEADLPGVSFGRRETPPAPLAIETEGGRVVRMGPERRRSGEATLSESEKAAFREIGVKLGQQGSEATTPGALRFEPAQGPARIEAAAVPEPAPVAETPSDPSAAEAKPPALAEPVEDAAGADAAPDIGTVLARLPVPAIVQGLDALVFANRAFLDFAGYADIDDLNRAGGLDALFTEPAEDHGEAHALTVRRADGEAVEASVRMQRIAFAGRSSLLMTFEREAAPAAVEASPSESDLRRELAEMRAVLDIATDGVVLVDRHGQMRAANGSAQALFGMGEDAFRGRPVAGLFAHESQKTVRDYFETLKDKGLAGIMNDGREVIGRVAQGGFVPLFVTAGRVSEERGWCLVIRDMSHWKRIEEELVNARRAAEAASLHKSRFLANISHELRTPLNAIIGFADVMASECFGPIGSERYIEYLGDIKRSGHHVLDLVNDLLDISKIEAGRMELTFESVSLNEVLTEVVSTMQPQANRERVIVRSNLPASVPPVVADRRTIRQIALNLLSNSVRFTPAGGQIIASTTYTADGSVLLRVRDSGIGMTASEIEMALTPFQQVQKPGETRSDGTGLGLPLTKAMAEANRADFAIRSTPGEGTLVEISFPAQRVLLD